MSNTNPSPTRAREQAVFRYRNALERGDFETIAAVLKVAERDPILWAMIDDLNDIDEGALERPAAQPSRPPRSDKHITQVITVRDPAANGQTPKPDHSQEDSDMTTLTVETFIAERPKTLYPFAVRFITLAAALFIVILIGGLLIEMVSDPLDGYPAAVSLQTETPKPCAADSVSDLTAESVRLATSATAILKTKESDRTPEMIEQGGLLALCAMQTAQTPEADAALLRALRLSESLPNFDGFNAVFSPDGRYVLSMADAGTGTMRLWDVATGEEIRQFVGPEPDALGNLTAAFSPDSRTIFSAIGGDYAARLWDVTTGEQIRQFEGEVTGRWESATFSPDGKYALAGFDSLEEGNGVLMWDVQTGEEVRRFVGGHVSNIFSIGVSPDSRYVATSSYDSTLRLWDMATGQEMRQFAGYPSWTVGADFSPDGQFLLSGGGSSYARLLNVETGAEVREFRPNFSAGLARGVDYSPDGRFAVVAGTSGVALLWDTQTGDQLRIFNVTNGEVQNVTFSPDGNHLMTGTSEDIEWLWPVSIEDTVALACSKVTRDFTAEERAEYGLGEGAACPA